MKHGFNLWTLKPKSNQSSGCRHIHQTSQNMFTQTLSAYPKANGDCFLGHDRKGVLMVEFMQQGTTITSQVYCETLKNCLGPFRKKVWNADIRCIARTWQCKSAYNCSYSSTARTFQLGVVWTPSLQPWSRSEGLPPVYVPEELAGITALQQ
jgi:hypothetical protein